LSAGFCIGAVGYDAEHIIRGTASVWNYFLGLAGFVGLIALFQYMRVLRKRSASQDPTKKEETVKPRGKC
jgi:hypothetical protein